MGGNNRMFLGPRIENETSSDADHGTELKLMWCLQRRGFALDMTDVVSWDVHEKWVDALFVRVTTTCFSLA